MRESSVVFALAGVSDANQLKRCLHNMIKKEKSLKVPEGDGGLFGCSGVSFSMQGVNFSSLLLDLKKARKELRQALSDGGKLGVRIKRIFSSSVACSVVRLCMISLNSTLDGDRKEFWMEGRAYFDDIDEAVSDCIDSIPDDAPRLNLRLCREYISIMRMKFLWYAADYRSVSSEWWVHCVKVFRLVFDTVSKIDSARTSKATGPFLSAFIRTITCEICSLQSLSPAEMLIVDAVLDRISDYINLVSFPTDSCRFYFNLSDPGKGVRLISEKDAEEQGEILYLWLDDISGNIDRVFCDDVFSEILDVQKNRLKRLLKIQWEGAGHSRRLHERHLAGFSAFGIFGYDNILKIIKSNPKDYLSEVDPELCWNIEDMSINGFGVIIPKADDNPIVIHTVFALALPEAMSWRVCLVRRFRRKEDGRGFIGIEVLSSQPVVAFFEGSKGKDPVVKRNILSLPDYDSLKGKDNSEHNAFLVPTSIISESFDQCMVSVMSSDFNQVFSNPKVDDVFSETTLVRCFVPAEEDISAFSSAIDGWFVDG
ncbi:MULTISPECIES: hypothetical protein [Candidatus Ichthyocystis]|uniref:PilZ domain-containing protein n=1 Tax=Candidatus Ichthyocystis hellenicum TaxID=1561003 RepID=A0A0S4LZS2_9BURK|nr:MULTISPECIES: hypothetical protein [Ichthyocystis]CUT17047.1 hypothetical protein Ark11_0189 [Candidatus Ichthyocystis hellenicum]